MADGRAKIADMGMSRSQANSALVTAQAIMTPIWSAPEVVNKERTSLAADMWSFGMLVWELATGLDITRFPPLSVTAQVGGGASEPLHDPGHCSNGEASSHCY